MIGINNSSQMENNEIQPQLSIINNYHQIISHKLTLFLDNIYYNNLKKLYNENLDSIFNFCKYPVFRPEYFIYLQYYFSHLFFLNITKKYFLSYSLYLHSIYISELIYINLIERYKYAPKNNIIFLMNTYKLLFIYLFYMKIFFLNMSFYKKIFFLSLCSTFYFINIINNIYTERLKCIENKSEFNNFFKILVITPNKKFIENIIRKTQFFTYSNYLFFINALLFFYI